MRAHLYRAVQDANGNLVTAATIRLLDPGTGTPITDTLYVNGNESDGTTLSNPFNITTGYVDLYLASARRVNLGVTVSGYPERFFNDLDIEAPPGNLTVNQISDFGPQVISLINFTLPASSDLTPNGLVKRDGNSAINTAQATADSHAMPKAQALQAINDAIVATTPDLGTVLMNGAQTLSSTTYADLAIPAYTGGKSGNILVANYVLHLTASIAGGLAIRIKNSASTVTNKLANPSFETNALNWNSLAQITLVRDTAKAFVGSASGKVTFNSTTSATPFVWSDWYPCAPGDNFCAGVYVTRDSATARTVHCDLQFGDTTATNSGSNLGVVQTFLGTNASPGTSGWTQANRAVASCPTGASQVRVRVVFTSAVPGDQFHLDAAQLEPGTTLPAFGNTSGGLSNLAVLGHFCDGSGKAYALEDGGLAVLLPGPGGSGHAVITGEIKATVLGTSLTNQALALEVAQAATDATHTVITNGYATYAKVGQAS